MREFRHPTNCASAAKCTSKQTDSGGTATVRNIFIGIITYSELLSYYEIRFIYPGSQTSSLSLVFVSAAVGGQRPVGKE